MIKKFSDFGIKSEHKLFIGPKLKISKVLNKEIVVLNYEIKPSKFNGQCLCLQIEVNNAKHIVFSGSSVLMEVIKQINPENFPFTTTIIEENEHYEFS